MNLAKSTIGLLLTGALALSPLVGCESLPGDEKTQGAVIGGVGGAAAGAIIGGEDNRLLGGLIGGALGAGGGYLIGSQIEKNDKDHADEAFKSSDRARDNPATVDDVRDADTADLNKDGFVTLDEVVAMEDAGLTNKQMIERLEDTQQVFSLSSEQEDYLRDHGVADKVIREMRDMGQTSAQLAGDRDDD